MGVGVGCDAGGILGLLELHDEHPEAIDYDLIHLGLRWRHVGTRRLPWNDLLAIVQGAQPGSAIYRALSPDGAGWTHTDYLLADVSDGIARLEYVLRAVNSPKGKRPKPPKPMKRPGVKPARGEVKSFGYEPMSIEAMNRVLGWTNLPEVQRGSIGTTGGSVDQPSADA